MALNDIFPGLVPDVVLAVTRRPRTALVCALLAIAALWLAFCQPARPPTPVRDATTLDSLRYTRPAFVTRVDTLIRRETLYVAASRTAERVATVRRAAADSIGRHADSLVTQVTTAPSAADSATAWHAVATARTEETLALRQANDSLASALLEQQAARLQADARAAGALTRLAASEDLNTRLARDVLRAGECRVLAVLHCPSRRTAAVTGVLLGAAATLYAVHRR